MKTTTKLLAFAAATLFANAQDALPGCGTDPQYVTGVTSCDDVRCEGLAFVESAGICTACMIDGVTAITSSNVNDLSPPAQLCEAPSGSDCSAEVAACEAVVACATASDMVALLGSPEGQALMVCNGAFDGAGVEDCTADLFACAEAAACAAALRAEDEVAIMATPEGQALLVCDQGDAPCQAELFGCVETEACAAAYRAEDEIALMATREGQAWVTCFDDDDPCLTERFACAEAEACAAAWRAEDRRTPRDNGEASCTPEGRAWVICRQSDPASTNPIAQCLGEYADCMVCDEACRVVVTGLPRSPTQADIDANSDMCVTLSTRRWPTVG